MTLVNIDLRNQGYETGPDDRVIFYSLLVREGDFGTISTAPVEVPLVDGKATVDLAPGPVGVQIIAGQVADTRVKIGEVPSSGPTTLNAVMMATPAYTPALQAQFIKAIQAEQAKALGRIDAEVAEAVGEEMAGVTATSQEALSRAKSAEGVAATANAKSTSATSTASTAVSTASNAVTRVAALEEREGLSPESPVDGQTANLLSQPATLTHRAMRTVVSESVGLVDLGAYGVSPDRSATENSAGLAAAILDHDGTGRTLLFPPGHIRIDATGVSAGGLNFRGAGKHTTIVEQVSYPYPVLDLQGANANVDHMTLRLAPGKVQAGFTETFRGGSRRGYACGIIAQGDNINVADLHGEGFISIVNWRAWDVAADTWRPQALQGGSAHRITMEDTSYGILVEGVDGFRFSQLTGSYWLQPGSNAPHLIYVSDAHHRNVDMQGGDCNSTDGLHSYAYQFKAVDGLRAWRMNARDSRGALHIMGCTDVRVDGVESLGDTHTSYVQGSIEIGPGSDDVHITGISVAMSANGRPVNIAGNTTNCSVEGDVVSNHTTTEGVNDPFDVNVSGSGHRVRVSVRNVGPVPWAAGVCIWSGVNNTVERPMTDGNDRGVVVRAATGASGHTISDYDPREIRSVSGIPMEVGNVSDVELRPRTESGDSTVIAQESGHVSRGSFNGLGSAVPGLLWDVVWPGATGYKVSPDRSILATKQQATALLDTGSPDVDLSAIIKIFEREALIVRSTDRNNLLGARYNTVAEEVQIYKRDAGVETTLASETLTPMVGRLHRVRIVAIGSTIEATFDGMTRLTHTLTADEQAKYSGTKHGLNCVAPGGAFLDIAFRNPT